MFVCVGGQTTVLVFTMQSTKLKLSYSIYGTLIACLLAEVSLV